MMVIKSFLRLIHILTVILRHACLLIVGSLVPNHSALLRFIPYSCFLSPQQRLRIIFEDIGGTFLKFGQMLALQPDILSIRYCNELFNLLDRVTPFDYSEVERIFVEELGQNPSDIFDYFEPKPLATASIGQVHIAYLDGQKLAVKVQRPRVEVDFEGDIRLMKTTLRFIKTLRLRMFYWLVEPIGEFAAWTEEELDYNFEARYMEKQRQNAADNQDEFIPAVLSRFTTRRTLVMEFLEGVTLLSYLRSLESGDEVMMHRLKSMGFEPNAASRNIINNFLGDVFQHGMFHADLHPANLMILPGNKIGYCDFGITGSISPFMRQKLIALTLDYTRGNLEGMCEAFFNISVSENAKSAEKFRAGLRKLSEDWYESSGGERKLRKNFTLVMLDMLRLSRSAGVMPERDVVKYIRSAIAIDGLLTRIAPAFNLSEHLGEVCSTHLGWTARRAMLSYGSLLDWGITNGRLMRESPSKIFEMVSRMANRDSEPAPQNVEGERLQSKILQLGAVIFFVSLLMTLTGEKSLLGFNLFTAELVFVVMAILQMMVMIQKSAKSR